MSKEIRELVIDQIDRLEGDERYQKCTVYAPVGISAEDTAYKAAVEGQLVAYRKVLRSLPLPILALKANLQQAGLSFVSQHESDGNGHTVELWHAKTEEGVVVVEVHLP